MSIILRLPPPRRKSTGKFSFIFWIKCTSRFQGSVSNSHLVSGGRFQIHFTLRGAMSGSAAPRPWLPFLAAWVWETRRARCAIVFVKPGGLRSARSTSKRLFCLGRRCAVKCSCPISGNRRFNGFRSFRVPWAVRASPVRGACVCRAWPARRVRGRPSRPWVLRGCSVGRSRHPWANPGTPLAS